MRRGPQNAAIPETPISVISDRKDINDDTCLLNVAAQARPPSNLPIGNKLTAYIARPAIPTRKKG
jgi:hypothetical protein